MDEVGMATQVTPDAVATAAVANLVCLVSALLAAPTQQTVFVALAVIYTGLIGTFLIPV